MAEIEDKYAFDAMNVADPDMDVTGGAIEYSEYEMDMTPREQKDYEKNLMNALSMNYRSDPDKGKLNFESWLKELRPDLITERARKWEELREDAQGFEGYRSRMDALDPREARLIEDAGMLQRLLNKHTGRLEDTYSMVGKYDDSEYLKGSTISSSEYRR
jgi:hypothetical protein